MAYLTNIKGRLSCEKCDETIIRIAVPNQAEEKWLCPNCGEVGGGVRSVDKILETRFRLIRWLKDKFN